MTRQLVCEGACNQHAVIGLGDALARQYLANATMLPDGKREVWIDPALLRQARNWVHTEHASLGIGDWTCRVCSSERRY